MCARAVTAVRRVQPLGGLHVLTSVVNRELSDYSCSVVK